MLILFDPVTKHCTEITQIKPYQSNKFRRCACRHDRLFITYWGQENVVELFRISTWEKEQRWLSPVTCRANELITCIQLSSNDLLALCIQDENNRCSRQFRFELRDLTLNILHTVPCRVDTGIFSRMTELPDNNWALLNVDDSLIFVIKAQGELIDRIEWPHESLVNVAVVGENTVAIRTRAKILFYDVQFHRDGQRQ
ncbi:unnamed protein product [Didymodactylos carnosus]|uniref:Uncharacterized protein n=1 Tax=Didymodactylos carnosus TaxID=1234261 RepID=A0A815KIE1_9BILA|nr:unnamed protein product [Didymodactylos carnosus]CAF4284871.1 unnamed protein product [Didymodactylos carnosus]